MTASSTLQAWINAKESLATLDYGLRSIKECGAERHCTGAHAAQLCRAKYEAARILRGSEGTYGIGAHEIRCARDKARELLKEAEAAKKAIGGIKQLKLAIAAECDCYGCGETRLAGRGEYYCAACIAEQQAEQGDELAAYDAYHKWADAPLIAAPLDSGRLELISIGGAA